MTQNNDQHGPPGDRGLETDPFHQAGAGRADEQSSPHHGDTTPSDKPQRLAERESDRIVKICKTCMISQNEGGNFCVDCGEQLVPIRSVKETCIGDVVGDKYTIVDKIGSGGMGDVYLGINETIGQQVAIKFLNEKFTCDEKIILRFLNEARSYCMINHPNAVTLLDYGQHDNGALYLITEYIEGKHLTELVRQEAPLPTEIVVSISTQVCEVLSAAHRQGVIHRDLKPDNLMLIPSSRGQYAVKVLDFGIAKIADDNVDGPMTETGSVFGTPEFMSPEQARGEEADPRTDLYALGVILYYMTTGQLPFTGETKFAVLNDQLHTEPVPPSQIVDAPMEPGLEELILRCLRKSADQRPADADEIADALQEIGRASAAESTSDDVDEGKFDFAEAETADVAGFVVDTEFDDDTGPTIGLSFEDEDDDEPGQLTATLDDEPGVGGDGGLNARLDDQPAQLVDDNDDDRWSGRFDDVSDDDESFRPVIATGGSGRPGWMRSAAIGVAATVAVVGAVVLLNPSDEEPVEPASPQAVVAQAADSANDARHLALLGTSEHLLDAGELSDVDGLLAQIDAQSLESDRRSEYDGLVRRASRARNAQMQLRAAVEERACDRARSLLGRLEDVSAGAAGELEEAVRDCSTDSRLPRRRADSGVDDSRDNSVPRQPVPPEAEPEATEPQPSQQRVEHVEPVEEDDQPEETEQIADAADNASEESTEEQPVDNRLEETTDVPQENEAVAQAESSESADEASPDDDGADHSVDAVGDAGPADIGASPGSEPASDSEEPAEEPDGDESEHVVDPEPAEDEPVEDEDVTDEPDEDGDDVVLPPSEL